MPLTNHPDVRAARTCTLCVPHLPQGANPVFAVHPQARIVLIGQAPGPHEHISGIPWTGPSGTRLREWLSVTDEEFYDPRLFAHLPMGFCYPGRGKSGDLPPRPECAPTWHATLLRLMPHIRLTLLIGTYAQAKYLRKRRQKNLTETVRHWSTYLPAEFPIPHPSPRNQHWLRKHPWFLAEAVPALRQQVRAVIGPATQKPQSDTS